MWLGGLSADFIQFPFFCSICVPCLTGIQADTDLNSSVWHGDGRPGRAVGQKENSGGERKDPKGPERTGSVPRTCILSNGQVVKKSYEKRNQILLLFCSLSRHREGCSCSERWSTQRCVDDGSPPHKVCVHFMRVIFVLLYFWRPINKPVRDQTAAHKRRGRRGFPASSDIKCLCSTSRLWSTENVMLRSFWKAWPLICTRYTRYS